MLSSFISENQQDWPKWLPIVVHSYRTTVSPITGFSPFRAIFGREARQTTDHWIKEFANRNNFDIDSYMSRLTEVMINLWDRAAKHIEHNHEQRDNRAAPPPDNEPRVRKERYFKPYEENDRFMFESIPKRYLIQNIDPENNNANERVRLKINAKLQPKYTGPYVISKVLNPTTYIANIDGKETRVHAQRMKRVNFCPQDYLPMLTRYDDPDQPDIEENTNLLEEEVINQEIEDIGNEDIYEQQLLSELEEDDINQYSSDNSVLVPSEETSSNASETESSEESGDEDP